MALLQTSRQFTRACFRRSYPALSGQRHITDAADTSADGKSGKSTKDAQPKILSSSPPTEGEVPEDVKQHNEEMKKRADRPAESVKDEALEKDKVSKKFWGGQGQVQQEP